MSRADKATEPSMDEILASIRKIIAEEPGAQRGGYAAADPADWSHEAPGRMQARKSHVDDVLDMADSDPRPAPASAQHTGGARAVPSWLFPGTQAPEDASDGMGPARAAPEQPAEAPRPFFGGRAYDETAAPAARGPAEGAGARGQDARDLGAFVPARQGERLAQPAPAPVERRQPQQRVPQRGAAAVQKAVPAEPLAPPPEPTRLAARDEPALSELQRERVAGAAAARPSTADADASPGMPVVAAPAFRAEATPSAADLETTEPADGGMAGTEAATEAIYAGIEAGPARLPEAGQRNGQAGPAHTAQTEAVTAVAEAAPARPAAQANGAGTSHAGANGTHGAAPVQAPVAEAKGAVPVAATEEALPQAVARPTVLGERGRAVKAQAQAQAGEPAVAASQAQSAGVRTLEDTVVDLLRPMIRQWLDDNMPRMVEKALRIELAASVKAQLDQPKH